MRASTLSIGVAIAVWPAIGHAHPFDVRALVEEPSTDEPAPEATSSKAPASGEDMPEPSEPSEPSEPTPAPEPEPEEAGDGGDTRLSLQSERGKARSKAFNRHGVGIRGGITVVPTWILARYLDAHANALCRGEKIGNFAEKKGLLKTDGCNFYVAGEYVYRQSRILDIVGVVGYQHLHSPDGYWLDKGQAALNGVGGADYTEVKMGILVLEADFIARAPLVVNDDVEFGLGGGGGLGLGIVFGGIWQTALGADPRGFSNGMENDNSCSRVRDLADFRRCTPRYDATEHPDYDPNATPPVVPSGPDPDQLSNPNPGLYANCGANKCNLNDLKRFGYRKQNGDIPRAIPIVNLVLSARLIVKDVFGITLSGGWNTGFYFGGSLNYFFGKQFAKSDNEGPAPSASRRRSARGGISF
ncbi:MAG TPA: hypothetical protein VFG69_20095 [Nannocystaceae bacterium]|nr:hypothetical protein [Nannocystaceae bacterium]